MGPESVVSTWSTRRRSSLKLAAYQGFSADYAAKIDRLRVGEGFSGRVVQEAKPVTVTDASTDPWLTSMGVAERGSLSLASVPLGSRGKVLGALFIATPEHREFGGQEVELLSSIGNQIGVAIENGLLYRSAQQLAVLEERNRLARDLHDSVTQAVYGVTLYAEAAARLISSGQVEKAADHLRELRTTALQALREMRSLIFELRPPVLEKEGLVAALHARLDAVEGRAGVATEFKVEGTIDLSTSTEEELYRIAQEALNNTLKHAQARSIRLLLRQEGEKVLLEIRDDGVGFDPVTARQHGGQGLRGIEERVERLGGSLNVESEPGRGTTLTARVGIGGRVLSAGS